MWVWVWVWVWIWSVCVGVRVAGMCQAVYVWLVMGGLVVLCLSSPACITWPSCKPTSCRHPLPRPVVHHVSYSAASIRRACTREQIIASQPASQPASPAINSINSA